MKKLRTIFCIVSLLCLSSFAQKTIRLQGFWEFAVNDSSKYSDFVMLPGSAQTGGKVWYKKGVYVPLDWRRQRISLSLERLYATAAVYVNGRQVGTDSVHCAPHEYDVSSYIVPGQRNTVAVCVNSLTSRDRNGVFGKMELRAEAPDLYIRQLHFRPYPYDGIIHMDLTVGGGDIRYINPVIEVMVQREGQDTAHIYRKFVELKGRHTVLDMPIGSQIALWDEFHPHRYRVGIAMGDNFYETSIGMRELTVEGSQLMMNRHPLCLRSIVVDNPLLGTSMLSDEQAWLDILKSYQRCGFNHVRFRGYCPTEAAFAVADRLGMYLQPGGAFSLKQGKRMIDAYGHHPSFVMMAVDDSMTEGHDPSSVEWLEDIKEYDASRIYCAISPNGRIWDDGSKYNIEEIFAGQSPKDSIGFPIFYYKDQIERNLHSTEYAGFQLSDFKWKEEEIPLKQWTEFCSPIVPLARFPQYEYTMTDTLVVPLEACSAYFGEIRSARASYFICDDSLKVLSGGQISVGDLPLGKNINIGSVNYPLDTIPRPGKYYLYVAIGSKARNHWEFLVKED